MSLPPKILAGIIAVSATFLAASSMAAPRFWDFNSTTSPLSSTTWGNTISVTDGGVTMQVSGWSDTGGPTSQQPEGLETTRMQYFGNSLGMQNRDEGTAVPDHSIDSYDDVSNPTWGKDFDAALLSFDQAVNLTSIGMQWAREDYGTGSEANQADISVVAYTDTQSAFGGFTSNDSWAGILNNGWSVIDNYSNVSAYSYQAVTTTVESKYWLVSIYNPVFGQAWSSQNDGFKLSAIKASTIDAPPTGSGVPSPGSLALLLAGLLAFRANRIQPRV